jgi:hypothetical protein
MALPERISALGSPGDLIHRRSHGFILRTNLIVCKSILCVCVTVRHSSIGIMLNAAITRHSLTLLALSIEEKQSISILADNLYN